MEFAVFLREAEVVPGDVALCLHKPGDPAVRRTMLVMVEDRPDLFEIYQSTHPAIQEATVRRRPVFASFVMADPGELTFIGLYTRQEAGRIAEVDITKDTAFREMLSRVEGDRADLSAIVQRLVGRTRFELIPLDALAPLSKRLVVADPGGRNYVRLAESTPLPIVEIKRRASVVPPMPPWDNLTITKGELAALPRDWALRLSEWRGIYLITDEADGARYVGAAYGKENLLGRWRTHVAGDTGATAELRKRRTGGFRFSILELLAPMATIEEVTVREQSWIRRLDTRQFGLNA
ncbi:GIY-YIG nuclease family protein [Rhodobacteraceae bacterium W635]|nr:GIY-YIG nuclease family protein [Rhodobacteraceae bacterium W635]